MTLLTLLACTAAFVFGSQLVLVVWHRRKDRRFIAELPSAPPPPGGWPRLAILVAARNEAEHVEKALRSLLTLDYPELEIVAVDDRSTDATGSIMDKVAGGTTEGRSPRVRVVHIEALPSGWLGKTHALHHAASACPSAHWLLFTDADVVLSPDALRQTILHAESIGADHVTVYPHIRFDSPGEAMFLAFFGLAFNLQMPIWSIENPRSRAYLGIGAFNLVRRSAFETISGFEHLKLSVDDDMRLGEALKLHGFKTRVLLGRGTVSLKWQPDAMGYVRGLEKNAFASLDFNYVRVTAALAGLVLVGWVPFLALAFGPTSARLAGAVAILATLGLVGLGKRSTDVPAWYALTAPMASLLLGASLILSVVKTKKRGGIVWRETLYPLAELKAHVAERRRWADAAWRAGRGARS